MEKRSPEAKPFKVDKYKGTGDPHLHLETFFSLCSSSGYSDTIACHAFQETLSEEAISWFLSLPPNSIDSFDQLSECFLNRFILHTSIYRTVDALFHIKQKEGEGLHELLSRWQSATVRCHNLEPRVAEKAFRQALLPGSFLMEINKNPPGSYDALMDLAVRWARAEFATFGRPAHAMLALTAPAPDEHFSRGQEKGQSHGSSREQGRGSDRRHGGQRNRDHPYKSRDQSPPQQQRRSSPPPHYEVHTTLTTTYEDIWARHKDLIPYPPKASSQNGHRQPVLCLP